MPLIGLNIATIKEALIIPILRAKNGHKEPYDVKIWDLGNEVDGMPWELGHKNAEDYIEIAREAAKAMIAVDTTSNLLVLVHPIISGDWDDWNRKVLNGIGDKINYLSIHRYWESSPDNYYSYMGDGAMDFEDRIQTAANAN